MVQTYDLSRTQNLDQTPADADGVMIIPATTGGPATRGFANFAADIIARLTGAHAPQTLDFSPEPNLNIPAASDAQKLQERLIPLDNAATGAGALMTSIDTAADSVDIAAGTYLARCVLNNLYNGDNSRSSIGLGASGAASAGLMTRYFRGTNNAVEASAQKIDHFEVWQLLYVGVAGAVKFYLQNREEISDQPIAGYEADVQSITLYPLGGEKGDKGDKGDPGSGVAIIVQADGTPTAQAATTLNFGEGLTVEQTAGVALIRAMGTGGGITWLDPGSEADSDFPYLFSTEGQFDTAFTTWLNAASPGDAMGGGWGVDDINGSFHVRIYMGMTGSTRRWLSLYSGNAVGTAPRSEEVAPEGHVPEWSSSGEYEPNDSVIHDLAMWLKLSNPPHNPEPGSTSDVGDWLRVGPYQPAAAGGVPVIGEINGLNGQLQTPATQWGVAGSAGAARGTQSLIRLHELAERNTLFLNFDGPGNHVSLEAGNYDVRVQFINLAASAVASVGVQVEEQYTDDQDNVAWRGIPYAWGSQLFRGAGSSHTAGFDVIFSLHLAQAARIRFQAVTIPEQTIEANAAWSFDYATIRAIPYAGERGSDGARGQRGLPGDPGTQVEANPSDAATETLEKVKITPAAGGSPTVYDVPGDTGNPVRQVGRTATQVRLNDTDGVTLATIYGATEGLAGVMSAADKAFLAIPAWVSSATYRLGQVVRVDAAGSEPLRLFMSVVNGNTNNNPATRSFTNGVPNHWLLLHPQSEATPTLAGLMSAGDKTIVNRLSSAGVFDGEWVAGRVYYPGEIVTYGAHAWECILEHTSATATRPGQGGGTSQWRNAFELRVEASATGVPVGALTSPSSPDDLQTISQKGWAYYRGDWRAVDDYWAQNVVLHNGVTYVCTDTHTGTTSGGTGYEPGTTAGADYWDALPGSGSAFDPTSMVAARNASSIALLTGGGVDIARWAAPTAELAGVVTPALRTRILESAQWKVLTFGAGAPAYEPGDMGQHAGGVIICIAAQPANTAFTAANWRRLDNVAPAWADITGKPTIPTLRTGAQTADLLEALTGDARLQYGALRERPARWRKIGPIAPTVTTIATDTAGNPQWRPLRLVSSDDLQSRFQYNEIADGALFAMLVSRPLITTSPFDALRWQVWEHDAGLLPVVTATTYTRWEPAASGLAASALYHRHDTWEPEPYHVKFARTSSGDLMLLEDPNEGAPLGGITFYVMDEAT